MRCLHRVWHEFLLMMIVAIAIATAGLQAAAQSETGSGIAASEVSLQNHAPLDGRVFSASIVRGQVDDGKNRPLVDTLIFRDGTFSSVICENYNFSAAPYSTWTDGGATHFEVELTSPTDGRMLWRGRVSGDTLEGTMRWTKKRWYWTVDAEHTIRGELADASTESGLTTPAPSQ